MKIGSMFRGLRAGTERSLWEDATLVAPETIKVASDSFAEGAVMDRRHGGKRVGEDISPELHWSGVPTGAAALVLIMEDVDVPVRSPLLHTAAVIRPYVDAVGEGRLVADNPDLELVPVFFGRAGYFGPTPIPGHGPHRYRFLLFAVSKPIRKAGLENAKALKRAMGGSVLARGMTLGTYEQ